MQTNLADFIKDTPEGREADAILRKCVHCGFCLATCPTYRLLGDELDSPRGRIYLMKQALEGGEVTERTQLHLDRCLTCRSCETTCPSGVQYGRLLDIGREVVASKVPRSGPVAFKRWALRQALLTRPLFSLALALGRQFRGLLPESLASKVPERRAPGTWPAPRHARRMLALHGCVQPAIAPAIDTSAARVLDRLGISLVAVPGSGCCGAVSHHLGATDDGLAYAKANIDAWWPHVEAGAEAIVMTASGCGAMVAEYGHMLRNDPAYAAKAGRICALTKDLSEVLAGERDALAKLLPAGAKRERVAFHSPCSLQHALKVRGTVESILGAAGLELTDVPDGHLCCGSAGTYSILQPDLARSLLRNKLRALMMGKPEVIATANIGCLTHLESAAIRPVRHWIEILDARLPA